MAAQLYRTRVRGSHPAAIQRLVIPAGELFHVNDHKDASGKEVVLEVDEDEVNIWRGIAVPGPDPILDRLDHRQHVATIAIGEIHREPLFDADQNKIVLHVWNIGRAAVNEPTFMFGESIGNQ